MLMIHTVPRRFLLRFFQRKVGKIPNRPQGPSSSKLVGKAAKVAKFKQVWKISATGLLLAASAISGAGPRPGTTGIACGLGVADGSSGAVGTAIGASAAGGEGADDAVPVRAVVSPLMHPRLPQPGRQLCGREACIRLLVVLQIRISLVMMNILF